MKTQSKNLAKRMRDLVVVGGGFGLTGCLTPYGETVVNRMGEHTAHSFIEHGIAGQLNPYDRGNQQPQQRTQVYVNNQGQKEVRSVRRATGNIQRVWAEHNVYEGNEKGMRIHTKLSVKDNVGWPTRVVAYFYDKSGRKLMDDDGSYRTDDGQVSTGKTVNPPYESTLYENLSVFIPYSELEVTRLGRNDLKFQVLLWDLSENSPRNLSRTKPLNFHITNK